MLGLAKLILVVEDSDSIGDLMVQVLMEEGYHAVSTKNATEALELLSQVTFDLITLDLQLPEMDGNEFLEQIEREIPIAPHVVVISANLQILKPHPLVKAIIAKPFDIEQLITTVKKHLD